jgi:hypothetical protein
MRTRTSLIAALHSLFAVLLLLPNAVSQETGPDQNSNQNTIEGTVVSSSRQTFVVRTEDSQFHLFVFNRYTSKPQSLTPGSRVRVVSTAGTETGTRLATRVAVLEAAPAGQRPAGSEAAPVPPAVQEAESSIAREARRWRLGVRGGVALNPELIFFGVHSQMGPIFTSRLFFRPNAEFAWGEVTDLIALNLEAVYRLSSPVRGKWYPYVGGGPALTFIHQNFQMGRDVDFGNFDFDAGFNILGGMQRGSMFVESKTSLYARQAPVLRLMVGYNF